MRFRYLLDPLFLGSAMLYLFNRLVLKPRFPGTFFSDHLNDFICIPFCVPVMLLLLRGMRLRRDDRFPRSHEILIPLLLWTWLFEVWLPGTADFAGVTVADPWDIFFYALGGLAAALGWERLSRTRGCSAGLASS